MRNTYIIFKEPVQVKNKIEEIIKLIFLEYKLKEKEILITKYDIHIKLLKFWKTTILTVFLPQQNPQKEIYLKKAILKYLN